MVGLTLIVLAGCNTPPKRDLDYAPTKALAPPPAPHGNGAIYQSGYANAWFENIRARRVGDMITIKLVEQTNATKQTSTNVDKTTSTSITSPSIFGATTKFDLPGVLPLTSTKDLNLSADLDSEHEFEGSGDTSQSSAFTGDITVLVHEVLPNGYLVVKGEKRIGLSEGNEYIKVSGIVRPVDIDSSNTVLSTRLADPTIVYIGDGPVAKSNMMGWLAKFFVGALMPF
jgi:flagellar L-ring protein precursor FlgH